MANHSVFFVALSYLAQTNATDTLYYIIEEGERIRCQSEEQDWRLPPKEDERPPGRRFLFFDSANDGMNIIE